MIRYSILIFTCIWLFSGCDSKPKVIVADESATKSETGPATMDGPQPTMPMTQGQGSGVHQVVANEVLQSDRYTYMKVTEGGRSFWIATAKTEAAKGKTYLYKDGLLKTNFESVEFKRTFDTIYLINHVIDASQHPGGNLSSAPMVAGQSAPTANNAMPVTADVVSLVELFKNKNSYKDKTIAVSGKVVKVNNGIMGRNWVHVEDGSKSGGNPLNLTVTTSLQIPVGSQVTLKGTIALDKDFGAGYRYPIIMENAGN